MSMKNSNDTIGNRTRDLPACSTVPQPTAPPCAPLPKRTLQFFFLTRWISQYRPTNIFNCHLRLLFSAPMACYISVKRLSKIQQIPLLVPVPADSHSTDQIYGTVILEVHYEIRNACYVTFFSKIQAAIQNEA